MKIPITKTVFGHEEEAAIVEPLRNGWVVQGPFVKEFEDKFAAFTGVSHAIATTSCTTALHIAMAALELKAGDEVIVPAFTWISTANAVEYLGAKPVFCDIDLATYNINVSQIEQHITPRTVGIIPVHLFGLAADLLPIMEIARRHNLWVVEDAACGFASRYRGQHVGNLGTLNCFSFHPRKAISTGEGGMITTASSELSRLCRILRDHGASRTDYERHHKEDFFLLPEYHHLGFNFRMTDLQGAVGCVQMDRAGWIIEQRSRLAKMYDERLGKYEWLQIPVIPEGDVHGYQAYVTLFRPEEPSLENVKSLNQRRNRLMSKLEKQGIATRQGTHAAALQSYYVKKYHTRPEDYPNAYFAELLSLAIPLFPQMTNEEMDYITEQLHGIYHA